MHIDQTTDADTGIVTLEIHYLGGVYHRDPAVGPAVVSRNPETGVAELEAYYANGKRHRDPTQGPARIRRNQSGEVVLQEYYLNDEIIDSPPRPTDRARAVGSPLTFRA
jgi:hypothetical protein